MDIGIKNTGTECMKARLLTDTESEVQSKNMKEVPGISSSQSETLERLTEAVALSAPQSDLFVFPHNPAFYALGPSVLCVSSINEFELWSMESNKISLQISIFAHLVTKSPNL